MFIEDKLSVMETEKQLDKIDIPRCGRDDDMELNDIHKLNDLIADIKDTVDYMVDTPTEILYLRKHIIHIEKIIKEIKKIDKNTTYLK